MSEMLRLDLIHLDGGTQPRSYIDEILVRQYQEALVEQEATFPPVVVFFDGVDHWLADGFHRWHGHKRAGREEIDADVRQGTKRDAILHSLGANKDHGKRRDSQDGMRAIARMLQDPEWAGWSDRAIARHCGVSPTYVGQHRASIGQAERARAQQAEAHLSTRGQIDAEQSGNAPVQPVATRKVERGGKTYTMKTGAIGKNAPKAAPGPKATGPEVEPPAPKAASSRRKEEPPVGTGKLTREDITRLHRWVTEGCDLFRLCRSGWQARTRLEEARRPVPQWDLARLRVFLFDLSAPSQLSPHCRHEDDPAELIISRAKKIASLELDLLRDAICRAAEAGREIRWQDIQDAEKARTTEAVSHPRPAGQLADERGGGSEP